MSRRRRNAYSSYYGSRGGSRGLADWFGLLALLCMLVCSVILLVQGILSKEKTEYTISGAIFTKENLLRLKPIIYIAMLIAYALLLPHIGFIISSLLLANGILLYFGTRKWWFYAIASANVIVAYFAFQAMSVTLP